MDLFLALEYWQTAFLISTVSASIAAQKPSAFSLAMGNDGGSIPTRRELVKEGAKDLSTTQVKEIQTEQQEHYWSTCALSHQPLSQPVVSDALGTLYNKDAVLAHLIAESQRDGGPTSTAELEQKKETFKDRIRSLRDVVEVKFHTSAPSEGSKWVCPVTDKVLGPGTKAIYLVPCGHAFAESLVATVPGERCLQCNETYESENIIQILPTSESVKDRLIGRLEKLKDQGLTHSLKKAPKENGSGSSKKRKKAGPAIPDDDNKTEDITKATTASTSAAAAAAALANNLSNGPKPSVSVTEEREEGGRGGGIKNKDTAALTSKVLKEQEDRTKKRKLAGGNENVESLFSKKGRDASKDFMTRGFSIPATGSGGAKR